MKVRTEITLSRSLFEKVDGLARKLGISRSQLISTAVQDYVERDETRRMIAAINEVYADFPDEEEQATLRQMLELHRKSMRDDPW